MSSSRRSGSFVVLAMLFSLGAEPLSACIWSYGTDLRGKQVQVEGLVGADLVTSLMHREPQSYWEQQHRTHEARADGAASQYIRNDYAVTLLHVGKAAEAVRLLLAIEKEAPGNYITAVNLGTAYELSGDDLQGLRWIREGLRRNANAHSGTEWLHIRILESKRALDADPTWLEKHSVLNLDFGNDAVPRMPRAWPNNNIGKPATPAEVRDALYYQLNERLEFVQEPNAVVGDLFFDWANLMMLTDALESAEALYSQALAFGAPRKVLVQQRLANVQRLLRTYGKRPKERE